MIPLLAVLLWAAATESNNRTRVHVVRAAPRSCTTCIGGRSPSGHRPPCLPRPIAAWCDCRDRASPPPPQAPPAFSPTYVLLLAVYSFISRLTRACESAKSLQHSTFDAEGSEGTAACCTCVPKAASGSLEIFSNSCCMQSSAPSLLPCGAIDSYISACRRSAAVMFGLCTATTICVQPGAWCTGGLLRGWLRYKGEITAAANLPGHVQTPAPQPVFHISQMGVVPSGTPYVRIAPSVLCIDQRYHPACILYTNFKGKTHSGTRTGRRQLSR